MMVEGGIVKTWSNAQSTIAQSSGEAEYCAKVGSAFEGLGMKARRPGDVSTMGLGAGAGNQPDELLRQVSHRLALAHQGTRGGSSHSRPAAQQARRREFDAPRILAQGNLPPEFRKDAGPRHEGR